jgi:hypothetical protein
LLTASAIVTFKILARPILPQRPSAGTNPFDHSSEAMTKASKIRRAGIPEPSFGFFLRAIGVMLLLVVIMTAYFSLRT